MKFASVALTALAVSLATPAMADHHAAGTEAAASAYPMTPQGAADWVAMVEKDMFEFSVEYGRVLWLNNTYIVHDSDQLAAKYGAEATEKFEQLMRSMLFKLMAPRVEGTVASAVAMCCADTSVSKEVRRKRAYGLLKLGRVFQRKGPDRRTC